MFYKFYSSYVVAAVAELYGIAAGAGSYVGDFEGGSVEALNSFFYVMHSCTEFDQTMAGCETVFFVEFVVVLFEFCHGGLRGLSP